MVRLSFWALVGGGGGLSIDFFGCLRACFLFTDARVGDSMPRCERASTCYTPACLPDAYGIRGIGRLEQQTIHAISLFQSAIRDMTLPTPYRQVQQGRSSSGSLRFERWAAAACEQRLQCPFLYSFLLPHPGKYYLILFSVRLLLESYRLCMSANIVKNRLILRNLSFHCPPSYARHMVY